MRLDRFFLSRIILNIIDIIRERIDAAAADKQYMEYRRARRRNECTEYHNIEQGTHKIRNNMITNRDNIITNKDNIIRKKDTQGYVISSCEADDYDYRDYNYYNSRRGGFLNHRGQPGRSLNEQSLGYKKGEKDKYNTGKDKRTTKERDYKCEIDEYSLIVEESRKGSKIVRKCMAVMIFIAIYLLVPSVITLKLTGVVDTAVSEEITDGKTITVNYKNASQSVDVEKFVLMVLADRLYMGDEVELLKAESIMIRTDIYRLMGEKMNIDSGQLGMSYMTANQMKKKWGKNYSDNYNLVNDCVAATKGVAISFNGQYIDARYTYITAGSTLSGQDMLGDDYSYLAAVECPKDKEAEEYFVVKTINNRDFVNAFEKAYDGLTLDKKGLDKQIQVVAVSRDGYVSKMQVGNIVMTGSTFARILGLNSPDYKLEYMDSGVKVTTTGVGDGFGVGVYTAQSMARDGASYEDILKTFYNGVSIGE